MKAKWINVNLRRKVAAWLDTLPQPLRAEVTPNIIITGGAIASMLLGEKPNDYDIYFRNAEIARKLADHYVAEFNQRQAAKHAEYIEARTKRDDKRGRIRAVPIPVTIKTSDDSHPDSPGFELYVKSAGIVGEQNDISGDGDYAYFESVDPLSGRQEDFLDAAVGSQPNQVLDAASDAAAELSTEDRADYHPVFISANAISLHGRLQLIFRFVGEPGDIHSNYDFVHCTNYWTSWDGIHLKTEALEALLVKELRYVGSRYPICSIFRVRKFLDRGFTITAGQLFKICHQISQLDLSDYQVLRDQLIGVDTAYFSQVLAALRKGKDDGDNTVDSTYLIALIDRIF